MPGTPIIYYGDEIGMGDNYYLGDRNGVRTPMQWSPDRNAGFSPANPQKLYLPAIIDPEYHYEARNVENQAKNPSSLLWWMKRMIDLRKRFKAFGWGTLEFITLDNPKVLAMLRQYEDQTVLVLINLSRATQFVQVNQPRFVGFYVEEMFSRNRFPAIKDSPYGIIMGPYDYHLMLLTDGREKTKPREEGVLEEVVVTGSWENVLRSAGLRQLEQSVLPDYLSKSRWFQGKSRIMDRFSVLDRLPVPIDNSSVILTFLEVSYSEGAPEVYLLPLHYLPMDGGGETLLGTSPEAIICQLRVGERLGVLYDGLYNSHFRWVLFELIWRRRSLRGDGGRLSGRPAAGMQALMEGKEPPFPSRVGKTEQSNSSVIFEKGFFLKMYRRMEEGAHPELEIGRFLSDRVRFRHVAPLGGTLEYRRGSGETLALGLLQEFVPNQGDAWAFTLGEVGQYVDRVLAHREEAKKSGLEPHPGNESSGYTPALLELIQGFYPDMVALIGQRTAEFHLALASRGDDPAFTPEPFALLYQRSVYQSMRSHCRKVFDLLRKNMARIPQHVASDAEELLELENEVLTVFQKFMVRKFGAMKTRVHGDYHLGQLLYTGDNFLIIDLEGEPIKSLGERRIKQSPLRDVACMVRSFHYAAHAVLMQRTQVRDEDIAYLLPWVDAWYRYNSSIFLQAYRKGVSGAEFMPAERDEVEIMLQTFMLDKAIYELGYELNNRPEWVSIPLSGILDLLALGPSAAKGEGP